MSSSELLGKTDECLTGGEGGTTFVELTSHPGECNNTPSHFMLEGPG